MTIDEAINIAKSDIKYNKSICCDTSYEEQLAEWLEELKDYKENQHRSLRHMYEKGYSKAIDDLMEKVSECFISDADWNYLLQESEQLKEGGKNES